jgi:Lrp/AsnC family transcriptional regulator, regulator for asnA, asnC and gidA
MGLDLLDKKIMYELDLNSRASATEIAKKIRASKETTNYRIKKLLKEEYIKYFQTILDVSKIGYFYYKGFVKLHNTTLSIEKDIINFIKKQPNCAWLGECEGKYNLMFLLMLRSPKEYRAFLLKLMEKFGDYILEKEIHTVSTAHRLNEKFLYSEKSETCTFDQGKVKYNKVDQLDIKIIKILASNARMSLAELGNKLKADPKVIKYRIEKMEKLKIIGKYATAPNFDKLNLLFIQLNFCLKNLSCIPEIIEFFDNTNKCLFAVELIGKYDLTIEIHVKDEKALRKILDVFKEKFINKYNYYDIFNIYKEHMLNWAPIKNK